MLQAIRIEAVARKCSLKELISKILQISQENTGARVPFFLEIVQYPQEKTFVEVSFLETLTQVFPCEYWKILKNSFFIEHLW